MNKIGLVGILSVCISQIGCAVSPVSGPLITLEATVKDESAYPIEGAVLTGAFPSVQHDGEVVEERTNSDGFGKVSGHSPFGVNLLVNKNGYYETKFWKIDTSEPSSFGEFTPRTRTFDVTLRKIINPRSLMAKRGDFEIPVKNEWVGYDFEIGDWMTPHGDGKRGDILVRYENEFLGYNISENSLKKVREREARSGNEWTQKMERFFYGNWSGLLEIKFPGEDEGIVRVIDGYLEHSEMRMPHLAQEDGYKASERWEGFMPSKNIDLYQGYFLRVRVVKRDDEIIQANYAKINEEIDFDPRGIISFSYYFNPQINDRNLEFDTDKNLLKDLETTEQVKLP